VCFPSYENPCFVSKCVYISEEKHEVCAVVHVAEMSEFVEKQGLERGAIEEFGRVVGGLATADSDLDVVSEGWKVYIELELDSAGIGGLGSLRMALA